jgi:hypothetical protein
MNGTSGIEPQDESRLQRLLNRWGDEILGRCPQAESDIAPLALNRYAR